MAGGASARAGGRGGPRVTGGKRMREEEEEDEEKAAVEEQEDEKNSALVDMVQQCTYTNARMRARTHAHHIQNAKYGSLGERSPSDDLYDWGCMKFDLPGSGELPSDLPTLASPKALRDELHTFFNKLEGSDAVRPLPSKGDQVHLRTNPASFVKLWRVLHLEGLLDKNSQIINWGSGTARCVCVCVCVCVWWWW